MQSSPVLDAQGMSLIINICPLSVLCMFACLEFCERKPADRNGEMTDKRPDKSTESGALLWTLNSGFLGEENNRFTEP